MQAVDGVSFQVPEGGSLGLVGESGCGKSTTGRLITRLYEPDRRRRSTSRARTSRSSRRGSCKPLRREIQMIFQDPYTSLNPRHTVGTIVGAPLAIHNIVPEEARSCPRVQELLEVVGLNPEHYNRYPHEFSGGQRQRIGIARALTLQPKLLVADEPVSALDVSIQAQVINLLQDLQREFDIAFLFIAHDLAVVRHFCPEVAVMYLGKIVEIARPRDALRRARTTPTPRRCCPRCPTSSRPRSAVGASGSGSRATCPARSTRRPAAGSAPAARWPRRSAPSSEPPLLQIGQRHKVACHFAGELGQHPAEPVTAGLLGVDDQGNAGPGCTADDRAPAPSPGYADTWFDLRRAGRSA